MRSTDLMLRHLSLNFAYTPLHADTADTGTFVALPNAVLVTGFGGGHLAPSKS